MATSCFDVLLDERSGLTCSVCRVSRSTLPFHICRERGWELSVVFVGSEGGVTYALLQGVSG